jgi:hypothetical protein
LLEAQFEGIMTLLRDIAAYTDAQTVMDLAMRLPVKRAEILKLEAAFLASQQG